MSFHFPPHSYEDETPPSLSHSRSDSLSPKSSLSRSSSSSSSVASSSASASVAENNNIRFFVLLLCPSRLYFELVTITVDELALRNESTIYDILRLIPRKCAERRLLNYQYVGFVRTSDQVIFSDLDVRAFRRIVVAEDNQDEIDDPIQHMRQTGFLRDDNWTGGEEQREYIGENDVLVAVLEGYSAHGMIELSEPVLRNPAFADAISRQKSQGGVSFTQASYKGAMREDNVAPPPHSSPPVRSFQSTEVMGVEPTSSNSLLENTPIRQEYADFLNWNDRCLTLDNNSTSDEAPGVRGASASRGGGLFSDIVPIFNSKGKFIDHESRGMLYQDNPGLTSPSRRSGSSEDPWSIAAREIAERLEDTAPQRKMRNKRYALIFTLLVSFVFIGSAIFLAGEKRESDLIRLRASSKELGREGPESDTAPGITEGTPRPTEKPTHKKHHQHVQPTEKPTHKKKHDHADRKPTKKPSHKKHNHGDHHPSTSTEKHDHGEHTSSQAEESTAVSSDTSIDDSEVPASATDTRIHIKPRALATVDMSNPDFKLGGLDQLGVDRDERLSFVHFELSSISGEAVSKATLNLYLTAFELEHGALLSHITIAVDALPRAGDWSVGSVSWTESLDTDEPLFVDELVALPLASDSTEQLYEVDVTSAILQAQQWVTFRLSTESRGSLSFASEQWNEGELAPELVVTLAADQQSSTPTAKPTHRRHDHGEHTTPTPGEGTAVSSDTSIDVMQVPSSASDTRVHIKPRALTTVDKSNPDFKLGGLDQLGVDRDERLSFVHFGLSLISGDTVAKATLNLYLTAFEYGNIMSHITIAVDMLPHAGDWTVGSVSWTESLDTEDPFLVDELEALPLASDSTEQLYEVDVTSAILQAQQWVTFRLSTESRGSLSFASEQWNEGELAPELVVTLAADQQLPTPTAKPTHRRHDHGEHTSSTPGEGAAVSSDTSIDDSEVPSSATDTRIHIKPRALATVDVSNPDFKFGGLDQLGVDRDERLSFVHFELSSISGEAVSKATLNLYLTAFELGSGALLSHITVAVDALPHVEDWSVGSVSWTESLDTEDLFLVDELEALPLASDSTEQLYEVDVTSAILQAQQWVTFRLSTESRGSLSFASEQWNEGELAPELVVTLAADQQSSTPTAKPTHRRHDHGEHTSSTPGEGTAVSSDTSIDDSEVPSSASDTRIHIKPRALATVDVSNPDFKFGGLDQLGVDRDERLSFVHFELSSISGEAVSKATLNLYLTAFEFESGALLSHITIAVDALPHVEDWSVGSVSWTESLDTEDPFLVDELEALPLASDSTEQLYEVDVTSAILQAQQWVTFRLSTESRGSLSFASEQWNEGELAPELVVTLAADQQSSTPTAKPTHRRHDHGEHTSSTPGEGTAVSSDTSIEVPASAPDTRVHIKPRALATVDVSNPDFKFGGLDQLGVDRDERLSFVHFELSSISGDTVAKATLNLYLTAFEFESGALLSHITIAVDALPHVEDWSVGSVSWTESLDTEDPFLVDELVALPLSSDSTEQLYEVDVTSAILQAQQWVTFRLSTESRGSLSFASEQWNEGELAPELVVTLAA